MTQGKAKYNKWGEFKDLSAADAQKKYVEAVKKLVAKYKYADNAGGCEVAYYAATGTIISRLNTRE